VQFARNGLTVLNTSTFEDPHVYLSTGCLHGEHDYCQNKDGQAGPKAPASCKFCAAPCVCSCHELSASSEPLG
jgi:hypothetical protein